MAPLPDNAYNSNTTIGPGAGVDQPRKRSAPGNLQALSSING